MEEQQRQEQNKKKKIEGAKEGQKGENARVGEIEERYIVYSIENVYSI